ncbi:hypothetical protein PARPLA_02314 [Rhodobacteraceae bacterium THAF1]|uniref:hypothetical protein n=1 Tax=Palleronia sp. THAF1 TaxID=2587842 RepID=UPI000F3BB309|nr:hypothetical protein [Palleronia sp. THAF1]QFU09348.1 hypothetical protein FIU81_11750 [Palleronia sp. THAF1]VDC26810.1 hypothetical protein PARPLA_02314 [Rhodobacteraceae bacterium THAF1]
MQARLWIILATLAAVVLVAIGLLVLLPLDLTNERVQQALVAAVVVALGWVAGFALRELSAHLGRVERLRDVHRALYAEIKHNLANLETPEKLRDFAEPVLDKIIVEDFVPFVPRERNDVVFQTILSEISVLPRVTIDPVVRYYSQLAAHDALVEDMRGAGFRRMDAQRRAVIYGDLFAIKIRLIEYGNEALSIIDTYGKKKA